MLGHSVPLIEPAIWLGQALAGCSPRSLLYLARISFCSLGLWEVYKKCRKKNKKGRKKEKWACPLLPEGVGLGWGAFAAGLH